MAHCTHGVALARLAGLAVVERFAVVSRISVLAELAVASRCVVPALQTNASTDSTRLLIDGHTEPTLSRVTITFTWDARVWLAGCGPLPWSIIKKLLTHVTVRPRCVMLTLTHGTTLVVATTARGVAIALAPAADLQVGKGERGFQWGVKR